MDSVLTRLHGAVVDARVATARAAQRLCAWVRCRDDTTRTLALMALFTLAALLVAFWLEAQNA